MKALLREPLVHFFLLGAAIFWLFAVFDDSPPPVAADVISVTEDDARRLAASFEATWRRSPNDAELNHLIDAFIREEVYVREAIALGLDRDDAVIRRRLQTKMEFLTESGAEAVEPDDATLADHLSAHPERFAQPPLVAFEQILVNGRAAQEMLTLIRSRLDAGLDPDSVGQPSLLPYRFPAGSQQAIDGAFGTGFFDAIADLPPGVWSGPVTSPFGRHLVRVTERREASLPPLEAVRDRVERDWRASFAETLREDRFEALRSRYQVVRPDTAMVLGQ